MSYTYTAMVVRVVNELAAGGHTTDAYMNVNVNNGTGPPFVVKGLPAEDWDVGDQITIEVSPNY